MTTLADLFALAKAFGAGAYNSTGGTLADAAVAIPNLARAATGYVGGQLGLLAPSQLPSLINPAQMPGTSENVKGLLGVGDSRAEQIAGLLGGLVTPNGEASAPAKLDMTVYHGTPHTFTPTPDNPLGAFDAAKMGTGEGAQMIAPGTYLADNPAVGQTYKQGGNLYKVDLPDDAVANMLHWDKPLSAQTPAVRAALGASDKEAGLVNTMPDMTGQQLFNELGLAMGDRNKAVQFLQAQGIPGIRYLDKGSRGLGDGTHNTVLFDNSLANILGRE